MTTQSNPECLLEVSRAEMVLAVKTVARAIGNRRGGARLRFEDARLVIEVEGTVAEVPANGSWPLPIYVRGTWVRMLAKRMPAGDPIHLRVEAGRLHANRYSESCSLVPIEPPLPAEPSRERFQASPVIDDNISIAEAARILKPLFVKQSDLEAVVVEARARGTPSWSEEEKRMIAIIAKAWVLLAPMGVETSDIRRLVNNAVRNAWK
jgi:hypothetical protein